MKLVVGLGNPGSGYAMTRHNLGAIVLDALAEAESTPLSKRGHEARYGTGKIGNERVILARPETYMNLSGRAVGKLARYYKIEAVDVIVIHDDLDIPFGDIRVKDGGGDGGHKGLMSIIDQLGSAEFIRIRAGIGRPVLSGMVESYVLGRLTEEEMREMPDIVEKGAKAVRAIISSGTVKAMNEFNVRRSNNSGKEV